MLNFLKKLFGMDKPSESNPSNHPLGVATHTATEVPYKIETPPVDTADIAIAQLPDPSAAQVSAENKAVEVAKTKRAPAKKAPIKKTTAPKATTPKAPRKPRMTVAK